MILDRNNLIGLYITIPLYFCILGGACVVAYTRNKRLSSNSTAGVGNDALSQHYLANRSFGPLLTAGTLFASIFSGYTVVGVPNDAFATGWFSIRWIAAFIFIVAMMLVTVTRLRKSSIVRNHQSSVDFITDRFGSQILRYTIVVLQVFPSVLYLVAQLVAIRTTFNSLFNVAPDSAVAVSIISFFILGFEWLGGLSSVALTDSIQGIIMVFCFIALPTVIAVNYGGWSTLEPETYARPEFYQTPSTEEQWSYWNFIILFAGIFSLPHIMQRTYAAESMKALKVGYTVIAVGPFLAMISGIFLGTIGVQFLSERGIENPDSPFSEIIQATLDLGGFPYFVAVLTSTGTLAAVMSTTDSIMISISQLITTEIVRPMAPSASPERSTRYGKAVSLAGLTIALLLSIYAGDSITTIIVIQYGFSIQAVPAFLFGLFAKNKSSECHP